MAWLFVLWNVKSCMENIKVVFSFDESYSIHGLIAALSLLDSSLSSEEDVVYDFFFVSEVSVSLALREKFITYMKNYSNFCSASFVSAELDGVQRYESKHLTRATYLRLELPELIKGEEKVIYSDVDVLYLSGLKDLWNVDIEGYYVAASVDVGLNQKRKFDRKRIQLSYWDKYFCERRGSYFQAGVLLMNLFEIRRCGVQNKWKELMREKFEQHDMDILNIACYPKIKRIGSRFNVIPRFVENNGYEKGVREGFMNGSELSDVYERPVLLHYAGPDKPWKIPSVPGGYEYWSFLRKFPSLKREMMEMFPWSWRDRVKHCFARPIL